MPSHEKAGHEPIQAEKAPDFAELQRQKEELFRETESQSLELSDKEKESAVSLVSNYSVKDGFELAKRLGLDGGRTFKAFTNPTVVSKNKIFFRALDNFLESNKKYISDINVPVASEGIRTMKTTLTGSYGEAELRSLKDWNNMKIGPLASKIDAYYSHFIRNRRVKSPEVVGDGRTQVEIAAEDHLLSAKAVLEESYYTGPVRDFLGMNETFIEGDLNAYDLVANMDQSKKQKMINALWALRANVIDKNTLDLILEEYNVDENDPVFKRILHKARYAPSHLVFHTRKKEAEKGLVEQIKESLIKRGFKEDEFEIKLNKESGEYEVMKKNHVEESENEAVLREEGAEGEKRMGEGLKLVEEIPREFSLKISDPNYEPYRRMFEQNHWFNKFHITNDTGHSEITITDGKPYTLYKDRSLASFFVSPGNTESPMYYHAFSPRDVGGKLGFTFASDATMQSYRMKVGDKVLGTDQWQPKGYSALELNGDIYWSANQPGKKREEYVSGIFKNELPVKIFNPGQTVDDVFHIGDQVGWVVRDLDDRAQKIIEFGDKRERFGPYDDIKLCENSKDKLIFYARRGDEHIVYVDGVEKKMGEKYGLLADGLEGQDINVETIVSTDDDIFICYTPKEDVPTWKMKRYKYSVKDGSWDHRNINIRNFSEVGGKLFYIEKGDMTSEYYIKWGKTEHTIGNLKSEINQVACFNDQIFVTDKNRVLSSKYPAPESFITNEITFDGPVELVNSGGKLFIIESLEDKKRVWEYDEKGELKLDDYEQRNLDLANAVAKEDLEAIENYFDKYHPVRRVMKRSGLIESGIRDMLQQSKSFVSAVNQTIKEVPELFMDTLRAKDDKPTEYLMTQMFYYMFPEAQANKEQAIQEQRRRSPWNIFGRGGADGGGKDRAIDYDPGINRLASVDESGYYEMLNADCEVLKLREPLPESTFITQGIFGSHTDGGWTKVNVPISQEVHDPAKETTFEFVDEKASQSINLPKIANGKIITERLKGITANSEEVPVNILEQNNLGEVRVDKGKQAKRVTYSQTYSEMPKTMAEITRSDYEKFRKGFERSFGDVMTKPIGDIGDELDIFVAGLKDKSPREQVIAIQEFCYEYGYYNLDKQPRDTNSLEERLSIMEGRMDELKEKDPKLAHKLYAGICTDFAALTAALLRKAGFVSGIASGFVPEAGSTSVKTSRGHAVSYVLWPNPGNKDGKPDMIIVDGTPSSITPKIVEQEKKAAEASKELSVDAEKELVELERILKTMDVEAIKNLENGKLEKTLNHILYGVKQSHVDVMNRVLNASRYAGFDILEMTRGNIGDQIEFRKFLEEEIYKEKSVAHDNRERRGEELFSLMLEFTRRFEKDKNIKDKEEALDVLEKVFDTAERYLDPIETRSASAAITYLRARRMR